MAGRCGNSVSLLFEFMVWQQQIVVVERARRSLIVGYTKILGAGSLFLLFSLFRISCQLFFSSLLPIFCRYAGLVDHAGVEFGPRKNTSSFTSAIDPVHAP